MTSNDKYVLVTGANSGLGLGTCCRLIDEYLASHGREPSTLTIIFTTRSAKKGAETLSTLEKHLARHGTPNRKIYFQSENVELTSLLSVRALSRKLLASDLPHINAIVLNAGIGGWSGLNWPLTLWTVLTGIRQATTWPTFKLGLVGLVTKPQFPTGTFAGGEEPILGEVFCANVFGHYMLVHWLMPLFRACAPNDRGKIIWSTSIEAVAHHYNPDDHQGLKSAAAYEHTKRMGDLLVLSAVNQPATAKQVREYTTPSRTVEESAARGRPDQSEPTFHVSHPGICTTTIISLYWIVHECYRLGIYLARWCGSPWANVTSYLGAASATWLALASLADITKQATQATQATSDENGGPCKWGASTDRLGRSYVRVTDVPGWGIDGSGKPFKDKWWGGSLGRKTGFTDATKEDVETFVAEGAEVWNKMEAMRKDWEARIERYEADQGTKSNGVVAS